jgi:undecaprenyl diphosphate synthase
MGYEKLREVCDICYHHGVSVVSVYALSFDNRIKRPKQEIYSLYTLLIRKIDELAAVLQKNHVEFRWSGSPEGLPKKVVNTLNDLVEQQVSSPRERLVFQTRTRQAEEEEKPSTREISTSVVSFHSDTVMLGRGPLFLLWDTLSAAD